MICGLLMQNFIWKTKKLTVTGIPETNKKKENKEHLNSKLLPKASTQSITIMKMTTIINKFKPGRISTNFVINKEIFFIKANILIEKELKLKLTVSGLLNILNSFLNNQNIKNKASLKWLNKWLKAIIALLIEILKTIQSMSLLLWE